MALKDFKQAAEFPFGILIDPTKAKLNDFLFDAITCLCTAFKWDLSINTNALLSAPTIKQGILEAMTLQPILQKSHLRNSKKIEQ